MLMDVAGKLTGARERLQTALQTINDAPVTAETKAEAVAEAAPDEPESGFIDSASLNTSGYLTRVNPITGATERLD